jgi:hypothetical protein
MVVVECELRAARQVLYHMSQHIPLPFLLQFLFR